MYGGNAVLNSNVALRVGRRGTWRVEFSSIRQHSSHTTFSLADEASQRTTTTGMVHFAPICTYSTFFLLQLDLVYCRVCLLTPLFFACGTSSSVFNLFSFLQVLTSPLRLLPFFFGPPHPHKERGRAPLLFSYVHANMML